MATKPFAADAADKMVTIAVKNFMVAFGYEDEVQVELGTAEQRTLLNHGEVEQRICIILFMHIGSLLFDGRQTDHIRQIDLRVLLHKSTRREAQ